MTKLQPAAGTLEEASILLDGHRALRNDTPENREEFGRFYVPLPSISDFQIEREICLEAETAWKSKRAFNWLLFGAVGCGKTTELHRILVSDRLQRHHLPVLVDFSLDLDLGNVEWPDLLIAIGLGLEWLVFEKGHPVSPDAHDAIRDWCYGIVTDDEAVSISVQKWGKKQSRWFVALAEKIGTGTEERRTIRDRISSNAQNFILVLDQWIRILQSHDPDRRRVLCVLDSIEKAPPSSVEAILRDHYHIVTQPDVSLLIVAPLVLVGEPLDNTMEQRYSLFPNVPVFGDAHSCELHEEGFEFFKEVIQRYVSLDTFDEGVLDSLFELSAGFVRDMIRNSGQACSIAAYEGDSRVRQKHVDQVWYRIRTRFRPMLQAKDYAVLQRVDGKGDIQGIDGVMRLLGLKAIVYYPSRTGEGWYGVHPAVKRLMGRGDTGG